MEKVKNLKKMEGRDTKWYDETSEDDGYVHYFGCGSGFMMCMSNFI